MKTIAITLAALMLASTATAHGWGDHTHDDEPEDCTPVWGADNCSDDDDDDTPPSGGWGS